MSNKFAPIVLPNAPIIHTKIGDKTEAYDITTKRPGEGKKTVKFDKKQSKNTPIYPSSPTLETFFLNIKTMIEASIIRLTII